MALAMSCGLEDALLAIAGVSKWAQFAWERGQIRWLIKSQSAVLPYGKMDNSMKGSLAVCAKQSYTQHKWPISAEYFLQLILQIYLSSLSDSVPVVTLTAFND